MTAVAPLPGRETRPEGEGDAAAGDHDLVVLPETEECTTTGNDDPFENGSDGIRAVSVTTGASPDETVDLTFRRPRAPAADTAGQASWVLGLALSLLSEGAPERGAMTEVLAEAAGRSRALEGAYGRAVALLSEYPGDPLVRRTVDLLAKALLRSRRPARAAEDG